MSSVFDAIEEAAVGTVFDTFAEEVVIVTAGGSLTTRGIYTLAHASDEFGGVSVEAPTHTVELNADDVETSGVGEGDGIVVRGKTLVVTSLMAADDGTVQVSLREYD